MEEQRTPNPYVAGSSPAGRANTSQLRLGLIIKIIYDIIICCSRLVVGSLSTMKDGLSEPVACELHNRKSTIGGR